MKIIELYKHHNASMTQNNYLMKKRKFTSFYPKTEINTIKNNRKRSIH